MGLGKMMKTALAMLCGGALFVALPAAAQSMTLFDRLGGAAAIDVVTDQMASGVYLDKRIERRFRQSDAKQVVLLFKGRLCKLAADKCVGPGPSPLPPAAPFTLTSQAEFDALMEDLGSTLDKFYVPDKEHAETVAALTTLKAFILPAAAPKAAPKS
jgi:truncated hemoglobin YjbI